MSVARYWREIPQRYRLEASKCKKCGKVFFPPRLICDKCKSQEFTKITLPDEGKILTYTVIHVAPSGFTDQSPYAVGIIDMGNNVKITSQIVDCNPDEISIGKKVKIAFRKINEQGEAGIKCYGYKCILKQ